jgi:hypothetical protein
VVFSIQTQRGLEGLADGELAVGDAELRSEGDLAQEGLAVGGGRAAQENFAAGGEDAEQALQQGGLAATRGSDERVESRGGEIGVGGADEGCGAGAGQDVERAAGEHAWRETKVARGAGGELLTRPSDGAVETSAGLP